MSTGRNTPGTAWAVLRTPWQKKRPTPEGAGLPDVVPFDIVNREGNYI